MPRLSRITRLPIFLTLTALLAVLVVSPWFAEAKRSGPADKAAPGAVGCKTDDDCALVPVDCCDCNEGGAQRAIAKIEQDGYMKARGRRCNGTMCAQAMSQHASCSQRAACRTGACTLAPPAARK
ncbi:MAG: hypothetical protein ABUS79_27375 [Pseudomonadota bacterium]